MQSIAGYLVVIAPYLAAGAFLLALVSAIAAFLAHRRVSALALGGGEKLESTILDLIRRMKDIEHFREGLEEYLKNAELRMHTSIRTVGMVRFNPFHGDGSGGNQSFSAALLDEAGNGIVISALHSRAGSASVYAKPVMKGASMFELTEEERQAIGKAMESLRQAPAKNRKEE